MLLIRPLLLALLLMLTSLPLHAQDTAAAQLAQLLGKAQTLRGNFSQMTLSASGTQLQQAKGRMALQRPRMFRWQTDAPLEQLLVSNGQTVWLYDPDLQQVTVQKLDERLTHTPALLLSGDVSQISQHFDISAEDDGDLQRFTLKPKGESSLFDSLHLSFKRGVIHDMQLIDGSGQRTRLNFSAVQMNRVLVDTPFTFDIPPGTDVIEE